MAWVRCVLPSIIFQCWGCPLWILALSMRPKELFTINFSAWDPFSTRAPMNIKLRDPSHKPKLSLILLRAWVGRKNDNGHLISFYIFGQQPFQLTNTASQHATVISQQKLDGWLGKEVVSTRFSRLLRLWNYWTGNKRHRLILFDFRAWPAVQLPGGWRNYSIKSSYENHGR